MTSITPAAAAPAVSAPEAAPKAPGKDKPAKPAPKGPDVWMKMTWDDGLFSREAQVGMEFNWDDADKKAYRMNKAWTKLRGPGGNESLDKNDQMQRMVALMTMGRVVEQEAAINALQSNVLKGDKQPAVKGGEFKFEFKGPNSEKPLVYFGVQKAMPAPLRDVLDAAREMQKHF